MQGVDSAPKAQEVMKPRKITVEPSAQHPGILEVRDAMQQVIDFFDLLTDEGQSNVVWNLTFASTNSPFTAEGSPVDLRTHAGAYSLIAPHLAVIDRGLQRISAGEPLDDDFPAEKRELATNLLKRNMNGIGRTRIEVNNQVISLVPDNARRALEAIQGTADQTYDYLFSSFARNEVGSIEGRIVDLGTDYEEPAVKLREHRTGREIQCRVSPQAQEEIKTSLTAGDVWQHRRVRVRGVLKYDAAGKIVRVYDGRLSYIDPADVRIEDLRDEGFTGGLPAYEYLDRLRDGTLG